MRLYLQAFRCYDSFEISFGRGVNLIHGHNGSGKTSILEAISMISPGRGLRKAILRDVKKYNSDGPAYVSMNLEDNRISIIINQAKNIKYNETTCSSVDILEDVAIVWLTPQIMFDFWLTPKSRRDLIDRMCMNYNPIHSIDMIECAALKEQRKKIIMQSYENRFDKCAYELCNKMLADYMIKIMLNRIRFINRINNANNHDASSVSANHHKSENIIVLEDKYAKMLQIDLIDDSEHVDSIRRTLLHDLNKNFDLPNSSNISIYRHDGSAKHGSTGEQAMVLIKLIINVFSLLDKDTKILLLDDVISHLDSQAALHVINLLSNTNDYIIMTDVHPIDAAGVVNVGVG